MPKLKADHISPSFAEDAAITAAAMSDPDALPMSDAQWQAVKPLLRVGGRPKQEVTKERITIRLSRDVVTKFRATGSGWQSRIDAALKEWVANQA